MLELQSQAIPIGSATSTDINASKTSNLAAASLTPNMASMKVEHGVEVRSYRSICTQRLTYDIQSTQQSMAADHENTDANLLEPSALTAASTTADASSGPDTTDPEVCRNGRSDG